MKRLIFAVTTLLAPSIAAAPASAAMMTCTSENMAESVTASTGLPESPEKMAMMKEMGAANAAMSKGDMKGACRSYMRAQKMGAAKPSAGMKM